TISRLLLEQLPENTRIALILNPLLSPVELLEAICEELRLDLDGRRGSLKALVDTLNIFLLDAYAAGLRVVLIIDEAQNLSAAALEQVRLLTNLETPTQKLLQIILLGQPELREQLARPELRQLAQRITARYHLDPLDADESEAYLRHRWAVAGGGSFPFTRPALRRLHRHAGGVPRLLNVIAERALLAGYARGEPTIGERLLDEAAAEVLAPRLRPRRIPLMIGVAALLALGTLAFWHWSPVRTAPAHVAGHIAAISRPTITKPLATLPVPASLDADAFAHRLATNDGSAQPAWVQLLSLWNVRSNEDGGATAASCPPVLAPGLFCASSNARLSRLAQFDRPAILRLHANGHMVSALLLGLGSTEALLQLDGDTFRVRRVVLDNALVGYTAVWRGPNALAPPLKRDDTGPGVAWLRDRLLPAYAQGAGVSTPATYDAELIAAVRGVQRDFGLHGDGVAGPETLLALMAADRSGPHLRKLAD
ncbi:MAG TPA: AAA family ATPase, partial [Xanthomonadaceae bacterium]|nr:AAA family ATPase [Xanthomonadaceae bacterium]